MIDRYATADTTLGPARIRRGDLVRISITAANRDPAVFADPDAFDPRRIRRGNLAFAQGPHVCVGVHLARLEATSGASARSCAACPGSGSIRRSHPEVRGLVFRKPPRLDAIWG